MSVVCALSYFVLSFRSPVGGCPPAFLPSKHAHPDSLAVSLRDLWELHVDVPGGSFDGSNSDVVKVSDQFGPWKLCSGCGSYKADVFACGGTCGGRIYLCSPECQRKCWKEHRRNYSCQRFQCTQVT